MAYGRDLAGAAQRHFAAAQVLYASDRPGGQPGDGAVAGYLYGLGGELGLKRLMVASGIKELPSDRHRDDPYWQHFPSFKTLLRDVCTGRHGGKLRKYSEDSKLFRDWDATMRYAPTAEIPAATVAMWKEQCKEIIDVMNAECY